MGPIQANGQATVEFAIASLLFFTVTFAAIDLAVLFYVNLTMQHAVREGTRYAVTGRFSDLAADRRTALVQKIKNASSGLYDKNLHSPREPVISIVSPGNVSFANYSGTPALGDPGGPKDIIVVSITYTWPLLTPVLKPFFEGGNYTFTVKSTMMNEPFPAPGGPS